MPEISVIVPVYKAEMYLPRCIDSILAQTFTDFELILVDDGSPDGSGAICDSYAARDQRVRVIHKENGGVSSARNAGMDEAKGNWIAFVDSDDYVTETYLSDLYKPEYELVIVGHTHHIESKQTDIPHQFNKQCILHMDAESVLALISNEGKYWMMVCWARLFNRGIMEKNKLRFDDTLQVGEDYVFTTQYIACCNSLCLSEAMSYIHTDRVGTLSKTFDIGFFEGMLRAEEMIAEVLKKRFGIEGINMTEDDIIQLYTQSLCFIAADPAMAFGEKYRTFRYLFRNQYFHKALDDMERYFSGTSRAFRAVLKTRCPLLVLIALSAAQKK